MFLDRIIDAAEVTWWLGAYIATRAYRNGATDIVKGIIRITGQQFGTENTHASGAGNTLGGRDTDVLKRSGAGILLLTASPPDARND